MIQRNSGQIVHGLKKRNEEKKMKLKKPTQRIHVSAPNEITFRDRTYRLCRTITGDPKIAHYMKEHVIPEIKRKALKQGKIVIARYSRLGSKIWFEARLYWRWASKKTVHHEVSNMNWHSGVSNPPSIRRVRVVKGE
jgi:hypothetical protein